MKSMMEGIWLVLLAILFYQVYGPFRYSDVVIIIAAVLSLILMFRGEMEQD